MWIFRVNLFRAGAVGEVVKHDLDDFYIRIVDPGDARGVKVDVCCFYG